MKWLRLYSDVVSDPKVQRLPGDKFKAWINLLCVASQHDGILPPLADLAFTLRNTEDKITALIDDLVEKGLLDVTSDDRYTPHNWASRQYKSDGSAERMKRHRRRNRDVTVTAPDTDTDKNLQKNQPVTAGLIEVRDEAAAASLGRLGHRHSRQRLSSQSMGRLAPPVEMAARSRGGGAGTARKVCMTTRARGFGPALFFVIDLGHQENRPMVKREPEVRRAKAKRYVAWCNRAVHEAPWIDGDTTTAGGIYVANSRWQNRPIKLTCSPMNRVFQTCISIIPGASPGSTMRAARPMTVSRSATTTQGA